MATRAAAWRLRLTPGPPSPATADNWGCFSYKTKGYSNIAPVVLVVDVVLLSIVLSVCFHWSLLAGYKVPIASDFNLLFSTGHQPRLSHLLIADSNSLCILAHRVVTIFERLFHERDEERFLVVAFIEDF